MACSPGDMIDFDKTASDLMLQVCLDDDAKLVTQPASVVWAPQWGLSLNLDGDRDYSHIFRLPNMGGWIQKWVYARGAETELVPENAIENSTAESTTIFRALPNFGQALPVVSTHWFLVPLHSFNGFTVGLGYLDVSLNRLDDMAIRPAPCGRFAMDEGTGEVFVTSWRPEGAMIVGWTQTISSCERVRELFRFEASDVDGMPPGRVLLRNSFYERRNCRICGDVVGSTLNPPCHAPASQRRRQYRNNGGAQDSLIPLQSIYRRFRGYFFGRCVKTRYEYSDSRMTMSSTTVPVVLDIRHGIASVSRRLRINLRRGALSFGTGPRVSARMLIVNSNRPVTANVESSDDMSVNDYSECSGRASPGRSDHASPTDDAKRRRNADGVLDRDSILHMRKVRNRESAARTNEARKRRMRENREELEDLKSNKVPALKLREEQLIYENKRLKEMLARPGESDFPLARHNEILDDSTIAQSIIAESPLILDFSDEFFLQSSGA